MTTEVTCARVRILLEAYVDGDLVQTEAPLAKALSEHLATCADCRRQHAQAVSVPFRLKALTSPPPPERLLANVMQAVAPAPKVYRRAWTLLLPEAVLAAFILWYLSGLDGLSSIASGISDDLQRLAGWGSGAGPLPSAPPVDVILLLALISLTAIAAYHLSVLIRLAPGGIPTHRAAHE